MALKRIKPRLWRGFFTVNSTPCPVAASSVRLWPRLGFWVVIFRSAFFFAFLLRRFNAQTAPLR